jgi:hypothetical protein
MVTGIMHATIATYFFYLLAILYTKIYEEARLKNCYISLTILPEVCPIRNVSYGHSLMYPWLGLLINVCAFFAWSILFKVQVSIESLYTGNFY